MGKIVDIDTLVNTKKEEIKKRIIDLKEKGIEPKLCVVLASCDEASSIYVKNKRLLCEELGILQEEHILPKENTTKEVCELIKKLNNDTSITGILVQLPLYKHLDTNSILNQISPDKDVDGFHPLNIGKLVAGQKGLVSCTPKGIMHILDNIGRDLAGLNAVVVGRSIIVGKPMFHLLLNRNATVTLCHSKTKDLKMYTINADILVVAVGSPKMITRDMLKPGSIVIDVGINRVDGKVVGDVDTESVLDVVDYLTPVPKGVGRTTVLALMENIVDACYMKGINE